MLYLEIKVVIWKCASHYHNSERLATNQCIVIIFKSAFGAKDFGPFAYHFVLISRHTTIYIMPHKTKNNDGIWKYYNERQHKVVD